MIHLHIQSHKQFGINASNCHKIAEALQPYLNSVKVSGISGNELMWRILEETCNHYSLTYSEVKVRSRKREVVVVRQTFMYLARLLTNKKEVTLDMIGKYVGGYHHTSVMHSIDTVNNLMQTDEDYKNRVEKIRRGL